MRQKFGTIFVFMVIGLGFLGFVRLAHVSTRGGETAPLYSNRRFDPYGTAGLYRLLTERASQVWSLERPRLSPEHRGVLFQVLGAEDDNSFFFEDGENPYKLPTPMLLDWVADGNTLVQLTRHRTPVMDELGIPQDPPDYLPSKIEKYQVRGGVPDDLPGERMIARWTQHDSKNKTSTFLTLRSPQTFNDETDDPNWTPLAGADGQIVAGEYRHGQGRVIVIGAPTPALNHELPQEDNLDILLGLVGDNPVVFDEWAHGIGHAGTVMEMIARFGLVPLLGQIVLIMFVYRWSTAGLFRSSDPPTQRRRSSREQIDTLGRLYHEGFSPQEKLRGVYDEILLRFSRACRCNIDAVEDRLRSMKSEPAQQAHRLLEQARSVASGQRPVCPSCGYDLSTQKGMNCSECGQYIPPRLRRLIHRREFATPAGDDPQKRWKQRDLARMLTTAHHLSKELQRG